MRTKSFNGNFNIVSYNIKRYREQRGFSQRQLCDKLALLGITLYHSTLCKIENNQAFIRDYELEGIRRVLNISYDDIFNNSKKYFED